EVDRDIFHQKPYWKEFRFDLTQIPTEESVTAAEFRIYKMQSFTWPVNKTLHVSIYEIVQEHHNREAELLFLDLQDVLAGTEGWLVLDIAAASNYWLLNRKYHLGLRLYVETEDGQSVDPGSAGLLGRRGPRSKQPFVVTFFRSSQNRNRVRVPRAAKQLRKRQHKKMNHFSRLNRLPGSLGKNAGDDMFGTCLGLYLNRYKSWAFSFLPQMTSMFLKGDKYAEGMSSTSAFKTLDGW
ncbi:hypothetical protein JD844_005162, partial [Phrynosoma platyrhinos]